MEGLVKKVKTAPMLAWSWWFFRPDVLLLTLLSFLRLTTSSQMLHFLRASSYLHPRSARKSIFAINPRKPLEGGGGKSETLFLTSNGKLSKLP